MPHTQLHTQISETPHQKLTRRWNDMRIKSLKKYRCKCNNKKSISFGCAEHEHDDKTLTQLLQPVYKILRLDFLQHNRLCLAKLPGCKYYATQIHHMNGRAGWWLVVMKFFFPICGPCHRIINRDSDMAIKNGYSVARNADHKYGFNKHTVDTLNKFCISPPN